MINGLYFFCFLVFISCNQGNDKSDSRSFINDNAHAINNTKENQMPNGQDFKLDSVKIRVVFFTRPVLEATYTIKEHCINITSLNVDGEYSKEVCERKTVLQIKRYISQFYLDKEDKIILNKTKRDYILSTDYPYIKVNGYQDGKEVFDKRSQLGDEEYDIDFNPTFLEFYEFLDSLVKEK